MPFPTDRSAFNATPKVDGWTRGLAFPLASGSLGDQGGCVWLKMPVEMFVGVSRHGEIRKNIEEPQQKHRKNPEILGSGSSGRKICVLAIFMISVMHDTMDDHPKAPIFTFPRWILWMIFGGGFSQFFISGWWMMIGWDVEQFFFMGELRVPTSSFLISGCFRWSLGAFWESFSSSGGWPLDHWSCFGASQGAESRRRGVELQHHGDSPWWASVLAGPEWGRWRGKWRILYVYNEYTGGITVYQGCLMGVEHNDDRAYNAVWWRYNGWIWPRSTGRPFHASLLSHIHTLLIVGHHDWLHHPLFDWIQVGTHLIFVGNTYDMDNSFE